MSEKQMKKTLKILEKVPAKRDILITCDSD